MSIVTAPFAVQTPTHEQPDRIRTVIELLADYADRHAKTLRSPDTAKHHAARVGRWCEGRRASETRQVVAAIVRDMTGYYAAGTINRSLGALSAVLRMAWERGGVAQDYSGLVKRLPERNARTTTLTMQQVAQIADRASAQVHAAIWISLLTGCRRGAVLAIRQDMIRADTILLPAGATKTDRAREVPIIAPLRPWLAMLPLEITYEGVKSGFRRARVAAGMPHRSPSTICGAPAAPCSSNRACRCTSSAASWATPARR